MVDTFSVLRRLGLLGFDLAGDAVQIAAALRRQPAASANTKKKRAIVPAWNCVMNMHCSFWVEEELPTRLGKISA